MADNELARPLGTPAGASDRMTSLISTSSRKCPFRQLDGGHLTREQAPLLHRLVGELIIEATRPGSPPVMTPPRAGATPTGATAALLPPLPLTPPPTGATRPAPVPSLPSPPMSRPPAVPPEPSDLAKWWARTREAVGSDLAVHGLAYLGVLLFFTGAFGLVVFAFGDVAPTLRPMAEAVIVTAPFAAAALLRRRGAEVVGRALEIAGGLVLPIMIITTLLDGVGFPPDLSRLPLVIGLTAVTGAVAVGYAIMASLPPRQRPRPARPPVACSSPSVWPRSGWPSNPRGQGGGHPQRGPGRSHDRGPGGHCGVGAPAPPRTDSPNPPWWLPSQDSQ